MKWKFFQRKSHKFRFVLANAVEKSSNDGKILFVNGIAAAFAFHLLSAYNCVSFVYVGAHTLYCVHHSPLNPK